MAKRVILGGLLAGVVVFCWGAVSHMATPLGMMGLSFLPESREEALLVSMKDAVPAAGLYFFPGAEMTRTRTASEESAWAAKVKKGPVGLLLINPAGGEAMTPAQLGTEFGTNVLGGLIAALLLSTTRLGFAGRVGFVTLLGLFGWVNLSLSYWNWYGYPLDYTLAAAAEEGVGWFLAGLVLAAVVRRPSAATVAEQVEPAAF